MGTVAATLVLLAPHRAGHAEEPTAVAEAVRAAEAHETAGRTDEAIAAWERVLALDPARGTARWALARALAGRGAPRGCPAGSRRAIGGTGPRTVGFRVRAGPA